MPKEKNNNSQDQTKEQNQDRRKHLKQTSTNIENSTKLLPKSKPERTAREKNKSKITDLMGIVERSPFMYGKLKSNKKDRANTQKKVHSTVSEKVLYIAQKFARLQ